MTTEQTIASGSGNLDTPNLGITEEESAKWRERSTVGDQGDVEHADETMREISDRFKGGAESESMKESMELAAELAFWASVHIQRLDTEELFTPMLIAKTKEGEMKHGIIPPQFIQPSFKDALACTLSATLSDMNAVTYALAIEAWSLSTSAKNGIPKGTIADDDRRKSAIVITVETKADGQEVEQVIIHIPIAEKKERWLKFEEAFMFSKQGENVDGRFVGLLDSKPQSSN